MKTIKISAKCSDMFCAIILDKNNDVVAEYDGYVPDFFPGKHYGDYVILDIDIDTGKIINWNRPSDETIKKFIEKNCGKDI